MTDVETMAQHVRAVLRLLGPEHLTPVATRQIEAVLADELQRARDAVRDEMSTATRTALAGSLYRSFERKTATVVGWLDLIDKIEDDDPLVTRYLDAAEILLADPVFQVVAGAISFPAQLVAALNAARDDG